MRGFLPCSITSTTPLSPLGDGGFASPGHPGFAFSVIIIRKINVRHKTGHVNNSNVTVLYYFPKAREALIFPDISWTVYIIFSSFSSSCLGTRGSATLSKLSAGSASDRERSVNSRPKDAPTGGLVTKIQEKSSSVSA